MKASLVRLLPLLVGSGARLLAACLGLLGTTLAARALGPQGWGIWVLMFAVFGWAQHVAEWGLRNVALVEGGRVGSVSRQLVVDLLRARLVPCAVVTIGLTTCFALWWPDSGYASWWLCGSLAAIALNLDWAGLVCGNPMPAAASLIIRPSLFLLVILVLPAPLELGGLALATFVLWAGVAVLGAVTTPRLAPVTAAMKRLSIQHLLGRGIPFFLVTLANQLAQSADLMAVAWVLGVEKAGTFGLVATIAQTATLGAQASAQWWLARAGQLPNAQLRRALLETGLMGAAMAGLMITVGPSMLKLLFGPTWSEAAALMPAAGLFVALAHISAVLAAWASARGGAAKVATIQLATQALVWPVQLLTAATFGVPGVLLLRGIVEILRAILLGYACVRQGRDLSRSPIASS